ncbi:TRAP transporter small permease [uncultured Ruegeria sp.]|uniref:TRAP transporter small permease n=1 Tax=uncultured Ruegeria sp. TaxID=259304 RepID=UPI00260841B6|nr:TRAP transporter small permease [uncultured Ruegeria sp.]
MQDLIGRSIDVISRLCGALAAAAIIILTGLVVTSVVSRTLGIYVPGLTDYAAYCLASAGAMGMAYTFGQHGHIRVEMIIDQLSSGPRYVLEVLVLALSAAMTTYLAYFLVRMAHTSWLYEDRSDGSDEILIWIPQAPFALGFCLFAFVLVLALIRALIRRDLQGLAAEHKSESWE